MAGVAAWSQKKQIPVQAGCREGLCMGAGAGCVDHRSEKSHLSQVKIVSKIQNFSMKQKQKYIYQEKVEEKKKARIDSDLL